MAAFEAITWAEIPTETAERLLSRVAGANSTNVREALEVRGFVGGLPFYLTLKVVRLEVSSKTAGLRFPDCYALWDEETSVFVLDGTSEPVHEANESGDLRLASANVAEYLRFFCFAVRGPEGPFVLLESLPPAQSSVSGTLAAYIDPIDEQGMDGDGSYILGATVAYHGGLFDATFEVATSGEVEMTNDEPIDEELPSEVLPVMPALTGPRQIRDYISSTNRSVLRVLVELLLAKAVRAQSSHRLIETFKVSVDARPPLEQFAALLVKSFPVVVVESDLPFVEETIAEIVLANTGSDDKIRLCRATPNDEETSVSLKLPESGPALVLLPMQVHRTVAGVNRLAFDLSVKDFATIIACERVGELPECLRRINDLTLRLPPIDLEIFEELFRQVFQADLPAGWKEGGTHWVKHVLQTDFEHPRRMRLRTDKVLQYVRSQVLERLSAVDTTGSFGLGQLHGMNEARGFAQDLIADIRDATRGDIPWSQVDCGVLLVGPPGTGKTTLAKAIARDCGVRFISISATGWQASGDHIGHHLRAIRSTFSEARKYAPSILFIDEIDSIGSRERFSGQNEQYLTEIVNAVLEQIQGIDPAAPVFVIGATNNEERVDPALRRAGRLDRVIRISRPNSQALADIFEVYIKKLGPTGVMDGAIDTKALGGISLGFTGADVERVVRGAARRARRDRRPIGQRDLLAEITNKPRDASDVIRLRPVEIERTAMHEAGHAVAMYLNVARGAGIGFVTIVPRADGSLGFVARMPDDRKSLTRVECLEELQICLAGRASEEIAFGEEYVSGGASTDLKVATSLAIRMVTTLGLGGDRRLQWSERPSAADLEQVERILGDAYESIMRKLKDNHASVVALSKELIARQELSGDEVRQILSV